MQIGDRIGERYEILSEIGGGGMAIVYKAKCHVLNRIVAVKVLRPEYTIDDDFVRKFNREAQAAASLSHPNIVAIHDVGRADKVNYIILEYVDGNTLKDMIRDRSSLSHHETVRIAGQICDALSHAHANGIVHRDIKSHNILISSSGQVKVTDFGIAKAVTAQTVTLSGGIMGSIHYFSPEQARGGQVGPRSDIYSMGVVLYEMMTGRLPFEGDSPIAVALQHIQNDPVPPMQINPAVPKAMNDIIMKALEKDEEKRFASVLEMKSDLVKSLYMPDGWYENENAEDAALVGAAVNFDGSAAAAAVGTAAISARPQDQEGTAMAKRKTAASRATKGGRSNQNNKKSAKGLAIIAIVLAIVIGLGLLAVYGYRAVQNLLYVPEVTVPNVVGKTLEEAKAMLEAEELLYNVKSEEFSDQEAGIVLSQSPVGDTVVKAENIIQLVVSKGEEVFVAPDLCGKTLQEAQKLIREADFELGEVTVEFSEEIEKDIVISQDPEAGIEGAKGDKINLVVSGGPEPEEIILENYVGRGESEAAAAIIALGLIPEVTYEDSYEYESGVVVRQTPAEGTAMEPEATVSFAVSKGPGPSAATDSSIMVTLPTEPGDLLVQVYVTDNQGRRPVYQQNHQGGTGAIVVEFKIYGNALVEVYMNGNLYDKSSIINSTTTTTP